VLQAFPRIWGLCFSTRWHHFHLHPLVADVGLHQRSLLPLQDS
jgi:hypothetical protein